MFPEEENNSDPQGVKTIALSSEYLTGVPFLLPQNQSKMRHVFGEPFESILTKHRLARKVPNLAIESAAGPACVHSLHEDAVYAT